MRPRPVGGFEPDDREQHELHELWHTSRTAISKPEPERRALIEKHGGERSARIAWIVDEFMRAHKGEPNIAFKWVYNWCVEYLGRHVDPNPVPYGPGVFTFEERSGTMPPGTLGQAVDRVKATRKKRQPIAIIKLTDGEDE